MDVSSPAQNRRSRRSNVLLKATLELPGWSLPVILRNMSQDGALVQGEDLPGEGGRVLFHRQGLSVPSRIAWVHCGYAGLNFEFPLFPNELLRHIPDPCERRLPPPIKKRPGFAARPLTDGERAVIERWATCGNALGE
jgi:hypothetical protein